MLLSIEVKHAIFAARTARNPSGFAAIVTKREGDTETLIYKLTFPTRAKAAKAAQTAAQSYAENHAYTN